MVTRQAINFGMEEASTTPPYLPRGVPASYDTMLYMHAMDCDYREFAVVPRSIKLSSAVVPV